MCDTLLPVLVRLVPGEEVGRVLMEISVTEQRYQAVLAVLGGVPVTEVASVPRRSSQLQVTLVQARQIAQHFSDLGHGFCIARGDGPG
jgi:hypothetical protein